MSSRYPVRPAWCPIRRLADRFLEQSLQALTDFAVRQGSVEVIALGIAVLVAVGAADAERGALAGGVRLPDDHAGFALTSPAIHNSGGGAPGRQRLVLFTAKP